MKKVASFTYCNQNNGVYSSIFTQNGIVCHILLIIQVVIGFIYFFSAVSAKFLTNLSENAATLLLLILNLLIYIYNYW